MSWFQIGKSENKSRDVRLVLEGDLSNPLVTLKRWRNDINDWMYITLNMSEAMRLHAALEDVIRGYRTVQKQFGSGSDE